MTEELLREAFREGGTLIGLAVAVWMLNWFRAVVVRELRQIRNLLQEGITDIVGANQVLLRFEEDTEKGRREAVQTLLHRLDVIEEKLR